MTNYSSWSGFDEEAELVAADKRFAVEDFKDATNKVSEM